MARDLSLGIAPDVAPSLIIGGLPSARLPFVYGELVVVFVGPGLSQQF